jgi:N-acetylmuramic acid 6-phosphate etherase
MPASDLFHEISSLHTEQINTDTENIDSASTAEILKMINDQDKTVHEAVRSQLKYIEIAVDKITETFRNGGRLFYIGAGTSGRLGVIDAAECPPTFGSDPEMVQGVIAGGREALFVAQEGAEDIPEDGAEVLRKRNINPPDIICGIAASGRTPFVKGALEEAARRGIFTIMLTTVSREQIKKVGSKADVFICPKVGPEAIAGSTRMKSGTAQKLVLNMLTTAAMVKLGKTYGIVMVDLQMTNAKLVERAKKTLMSITGLGYDAAGELLEECQWHVKTALVAELASVSPKKARELLDKSDGFVKKALEQHDT